MSAAIDDVTATKLHANQQRSALAQFGWALMQAGSALLVLLGQWAASANRVCRRHSQTPWRIGSIFVFVVADALLIIAHGLQWLTTFLQTGICGAIVTYDVISMAGSLVVMPVLLLMSMVMVLATPSRFMTSGSDPTGAVIATWGSLNANIILFQLAKWGLNYFGIRVGFPWLETARRRRNASP